MKIKYQILLIIVILNFSCKPNYLECKNHYSFFEEKPLNDNKVLEKIDEFLKYEKDLGIENKTILLFTKENIYSDNVQKYYISSTSALSTIYYHPCSGYFLYKGIIVLVYSKSIGFANPVNYPKKFLNKVSKNLIDNWFFYREDCKYDPSPKINMSEHLTFFQIAKNRIISERVKFSEFTLDYYGVKYYSYTDFVNLDNFRIIDLKKCD